MVKKENKEGVLRTRLAHLIVTVFLISLVMVIAQDVSHTADQIIKGTFSSGNFTFSNSLFVTDTLGVGTTNPSDALTVVGDINVTGNITDAFNGIIGIPPGFVGFFNLTGCPTGWHEDIAARGRYLVGYNSSSGTLGGTAGTALSNQENRTVGQHNHGITDPGHTHPGPNDELFKTVNTAGAADFSGGTGTRTIFERTVTGTASTDITVNTNGTVEGTNAPYIQYLICVKN
ncbi:hypothetical protein J4414_01060 [Candidatus Woesearchaeota archaeon]|nr:hypothetical protein [Candidatus Woesearchaeota archaeon]